MDAVTNKRLRIIISVVYFALILGAFYLIFKTFFGILVPFIAAFLIAAGLTALSSGHPSWPYLLLFGAAVVLLALGLLFLWIFVWFIAGAIAGLIAGVIRLGGSWCYKEVAA